MKSFQTVVVGVADLNQALRLWVDGFDFDLKQTRDGADSQLAALWDIDANDIACQALVASPNEAVGMLHLVEFISPNKAVREGANVFDTCPKNLDIYVENMPTQINFLKSLGHTFHSENYTEIVTHDGIKAREIHMVGHDEINVVLLERDIAGMQYSNHGFAGVGPLITAVNDADQEKDFYANLLGLSTLEQYDLRGPEIETMIGLPQGAGVHFSILGYQEAPLGRIEIVSYDGVSGKDLFEFAKPKHRGILHISYRNLELSELKNRLSKLGIEFKEHGMIKTLAAQGNCLSFNSPAGFRIEVIGD